MLTSFADSHLFGESYGAGTPWVLALHGWRRDHRDFEAVLRHSGIDAIALDLPGFGSAAAPEEVWGSSDYAEAVAAVLDEMSAQVVVLGHSFGGRVAVHLAASHPDQIRGSCLDRSAATPTPWRRCEAVAAVQGGSWAGGPRIDQSGQDRGAATALRVR